MKAIKSKKSQFNNGAKFLILFFLVAFFNSSVAQTDPGTYLQPETNPTSEPCLPGATSWYLGGNVLASTQWGSTGPIGPLPENTAGTCNDYPFVLKANNNKSVFIMPSGRVGIGINNSSPASQVDISDGIINPNSNISDHTRIFGNFEGAIESTERMSLFYQSGFSIHQGSFAGQNLPFFSIDQAGNTSISGITNVGIQASAGNLANFNVNVAGSSNGAINAIDVFDQYTNKVNFRVKSDGSVYARYVKVTVSSFPDYVFASSYNLPSLETVEAYYKKHKHLSEVPSASEVENMGLDLGEMNKLLLKKIEELTIYMVEQNKKTDELQIQFNLLENQIKRLSKNKN